jgi:hypothetical protein
MQEARMIMTQMHHHHHQPGHDLPKAITDRQLHALHAQRLLRHPMTKRKEEKKTNNHLKTIMEMKHPHPLKAHHRHPVTMWMASARTVPSDVLDAPSLLSAIGASG